MMNFDTDLDRQGVTRLVKTEMVIEEEVVVRQRPSVARRHLLNQEWGWEEIRDYVVTEIEKRIGQFPRVIYKEDAIFKRFVREWGDQAAGIARYAFETMDGRWGGAPININRFCEKSDPFFARPISERLVTSVLPTDW